MIDIDDIVLKIAEKLRERATRQGVVPFKKGGLRKSITVYHLGNGIASVGSNLPYARAVHDGRKALLIRPNLRTNPPLGKRVCQIGGKSVSKTKYRKRARLRFKIGGKFVFARKVFQPAREGRPWLRDAALEMQKEGFSFLVPGLKKKIGEELAKSIVKEIKINL
jgi:hypothetical protein